MPGRSALVYQNFPGVQMVIMSPLGLHFISFPTWDPDLCAGSQEVQGKPTSRTAGISVWVMAQSLEFQPGMGCMFSRLMDPRFS